MINTDEQFVSCELFRSKTNKQNGEYIYIYIYIYERLKWFVKQNQVHKTKFCHSTKCLILYHFVLCTWCCFTNHFRRL